MTTEQYSIGYDAGYQDGFDAALAEPVKQEPVAKVTDVFPTRVEWLREVAVNSLLYAAPVSVEAIRAEALEEAAKVCDEMAKHYITNHKEQEQVWLLAATSDCAAAIRARGEK